MKNASPKSASIPAMAKALLATVLIYFAFAQMPGMVDWLATKAQWIAGHLPIVVFGVLLLAVLAWRRTRDYFHWLSSHFCANTGSLGLLMVFAGIFVFLATQERVTFTHHFTHLVVIWCGFSLIALPDSTHFEETKDWLHRKHMVDRLAEFLVTMPGSAKRIGIIGPWGDGKTHTLKLLQEELDRRKGGEKFRMTWVNPWRAKSSQEAWEEIAKGVDAALGFPRLLPQSLLSLPWLGSLLELLPVPLSGMTHNVKTLMSSESDQAKQIGTGLESFLKGRDQWLLVFVDDMERVGKEQLRSLFPVIDRLGEIDRCFFVFAIDPDRVSKAFGESTDTADESRGYLDKVLDLQLTLPAPSQDDIRRALEKRIDPQKHPKLAAALPKIAGHLPTNARQAFRFLREAQSRELLFLNRFGDSEHSYQGFFMILLIELRFPSAFAKLPKALTSLYSTASLHTVMGVNPESVEAKEEISKLAKTLAPEAEIIETHPLFPIITELFDITFGRNRIFDQDKPLDLDWVFSGHKKLLRFTLAEREQFIVQWQERAGEIGFSEMLAAVGSFSEPELSVQQALEMEISAISGSLGQAYRSIYSETELESLWIDVSTRISRFRAHAKATQPCSFPDLDKLVFAEPLMETWMHMISQNSLHGLPEGFANRVQKLRAEATLEFARCLEPAARFHWCMRKALEPAELTEGDHSSNFLGELKPIRDELLAEGSRKVLSLFESESIQDAFPVPCLGNTQLASLANPNAWLKPDPDQFQGPLEQLAIDAAENQASHSNFVFILHRIILGPFGYPPEQSHYEHEEIRIAAKKFPWYLGACWRGASAAPVSTYEFESIKRLLTKGIKTEERLTKSDRAEDSILEALQSMELSAFTTTDQAASS